MRHRSPHRYTIYGNVDGLFTGGQMPSIECKNMSFEKALRIFRKKCDNAGIKEECRARKYHIKPNETRNQQNNSRKRNLELEARKRKQSENTRLVIRKTPKKKKFKGR